jgi:hypothetical protein
MNKEMPQRGIMLIIIDNNNFLCLGSEILFGREYPNKLPIAILLMFGKPPIFYRGRSVHASINPSIKGRFVSARAVAPPPVFLIKLYFFIKGMPNSDVGVFTLIYSVHQCFKLGAVAIGTIAPYPENKIIGVDHLVQQGIYCLCKRLQRQQRSG